MPWRVRQGLMLVGKLLWPKWVFNLCYWILFQQKIKNVYDPFSRTPPYERKFIFPNMPEAFIAKIISTWGKFSLPNSEKKILLRNFLYKFLIFSKLVFLLIFKARRKLLKICLKIFNKKPEVVRKIKKFPAHFKKWSLPPL